MPWFRRATPHYLPPSGPPPTDLPDWTASGSQSYANGLYSDAPENEYEDAEAFCAAQPLESPRLLSAQTVQSIKERGEKCWGLEIPRLSRFRGRITNDRGEGGSNDLSGLESGLSTVRTSVDCGDTCLFSTIPIIGGLYQHPPGQLGVYYEIKVYHMASVVAIGNCRVLS